MGNANQVRALGGLCLDTLEGSRQGRLFKEERQEDLPGFPVPAQGVWFSCNKRLCSSSPPPRMCVNYPGGSTELWKPHLTC